MTFWMSLDDGCFDCRMTFWMTDDVLDEVR